MNLSIKRQGAGVLGQLFVRRIGEPENGLPCVGGLRPGGLVEGF